jgi:hypothetical protein
VYKTNVTIAFVSSGGDDAFETHSHAYVSVQVYDFEADLGGHFYRHSRLRNSQLISVFAVLCLETTLRQYNVSTLDSIGEAVSQFSQFHQFRLSQFYHLPCAFDVCDNCFEPFTNRRGLLFELLQ